MLDVFGISSVILFLLAILALVLIIGHVISAIVNIERDKEEIAMLDEQIRKYDQEIALMKEERQKAATVGRGYSLSAEEERKKQQFIALFEEYRMGIGKEVAL